MIDVNRAEAILQTLSGLALTVSVKNKEFGFTKADSNNAVQDIADAKMLVRHEVFKEYKDQIYRHFCIFETRAFEEDEFLKDHCFVAARWGVAVRKYHNRYYAVKILNPDNMWSGIIQTESPDDYPLHSFPEGTICSDYPELVIIKVINQHIEEGDA